MWCLRISISKSWSIFTFSVPKNAILFQNLFNFKNMSWNFCWKKFLNFRWKWILMSLILTYKGGQIWPPPDSLLKFLTPDPFPSCQHHRLNVENFPCEKYWNIPKFDDFVGAQGLRSEVGGLPSTISVLYVLIVCFPPSATFCDFWRGERPCTGTFSVPTMLGDTRINNLQVHGIFFDFIFKRYTSINTLGNSILTLTGFRGYSSNSTVLYDNLGL